MVVLAIGLGFEASYNPSATPIPPGGPIFTADLEVLVELLDQTSIRRPGLITGVFANTDLLLSVIVKKKDSLNPGSLIPVDLTGRAVKFTGKRNTEAATSLFDVLGIITDAVNGKVDFAVPGSSLVPSPLGVADVTVFETTVTSVPPKYRARFSVPVMKALS